MARRSKLTWHEEVLDWEALRAADRLAPIAGQFYLAGGTGLSLRLGHRISLDLDLFSNENRLEAPERASLLAALRESGPVEIREGSDGTLHLLLEGTRVSLLRYRYPLLGKPDVWRGIRIAAVEDIAAMKVAAIIGRGAKKDFLDLHALATRQGLEPLLLAAKRKFADHPDLLLQSARALVYFDDAEKEPTPRSFRAADWELVKRYFEREVPRLVDRLLR